MNLFLRQVILPLVFIFFCSGLLAEKAGNGVPGIYFFSLGNKYDTTVGISKYSIKICSCQVLELQSTNHRHRNIALFAEKSNGRSLLADMGRMNRVIEKEKKHMQSFFYDKLTVVNVFTEATDCRSLYARLKNKNRSLVLYDILNADTRR